MSTEPTGGGILGRAGGYQRRAAQGAAAQSADAAERTQPGESARALAEPAPAPAPAPAPSPAPAAAPDASPAATPQAPTQPPRLGNIRGYQRQAQTLAAEAAADAAERTQPGESARAEAENAAIEAAAVAAAAAPAPAAGGPQPAARVGDQVGQHAATSVGQVAGWGTTIGALGGAGLGIGLGALAIFATGGLATPFVAAAYIGAAAGAVSLTAAGGAAGLRYDAARAHEHPAAAPCSGITSGSPNVFIEGKAVARATEDRNSHGGGSGSRIAQGSATVLVNGKPLARIHDHTECGGEIVSGAARTIIGGPPSASAAGAGAAAASGLLARALDSDVESAAGMLDTVAEYTGILGLVAGAPAAGARAALVLGLARAGQPSLTAATVLGAPTMFAADRAGRAAGEVGSEQGARLGRDWFGGDSGAILGSSIGGIGLGVAGGFAVGAAAHRATTSGAERATGARGRAGRSSSARQGGSEEPAGRSARESTPERGGGSGGAGAEQPHGGASERACPTCSGGASGGRGLSRQGATPVRGNFSQSQVLTRGNSVLKRVRNPGRNGLDYQSRVRMAQRLAEAHNRVSDAVGEDVVPRLQNLTHDDGRASQWLAQQRVEGNEYSQLSPAARETAQTQMRDYVGRARNALGLEGTPERTESGVTYRVDDYNAGNFRFDSEGNVTSWFDPVYMESAGDRPVTSDAPLRFGQSEGEATARSGSRLVDDDATVRLRDDDATVRMRDDDATVRQQRPLVDDDATVRQPQREPNVTPHPEPNRNIVRTLPNDVWGGERNQVRLAGRLNDSPGMDHLANLPGVTDVIIHGSANEGFWVQRRPGTREATALAASGAELSGWQARVSTIAPDGSQFVTPEHLANVLRRLGVTGDVRLISCNTGQLGTIAEGTAARFAQAWSQSGERVYAYQTTVGVDQYGNVHGWETDASGARHYRDPGLTAFDVRNGRVEASGPDNADIMQRFARSQAQRPAAAPDAQGDAPSCPSCGGAAPTSAAQTATAARGEGLASSPRAAAGPAAALGRGGARAGGASSSGGSRSGEAPRTTPRTTPPARQPGGPPVTDPTVYRHYTDEAGYRAFQESGVIRANDRNQVFVTRDQLTPDQAFTNLFIGNPRYAGRGEYVIEFLRRDGTELHTGKNEELHHYGSLREGRNIEVLNAGPNPTSEE